jgi:uncharacterized protein (DUF3820 family)
MALPDDFYETPFPNFGKHAGTPVSDVPLSYLDWIVGKWEDSGIGGFMHGRYDDFFHNLKLYMKQDVIQHEFENECPDPFDIIPE